MEKARNMAHRALAETEYIHVSIWTRLSECCAIPRFPAGTVSAFAVFMAGRHEDLICWQLADQLRQMIIKHTAEGTTAARDYRFASNLRDAIASVCRNQAEGFAKYKHKPQRPYFNTARSSLAEVKDGIRDGHQRGYFSEDVAKEMYNLRRRADVANLRYLQSLDRPDPPDRF